VRAFQLSYETDGAQRGDVSNRLEPPKERSGKPLCNSLACLKIAGASLNLELYLKLKRVTYPVIFAYRTFDRFARLRSFLGQ
jgi:hypothetical protein